MQNTETSEYDSRLLLAMIVIVILGILLGLPFTTVADKPDPDGKVLSGMIDTFGDYGSWAGGMIGALAGLITIYFVKKTFQQQAEALKIAQNTNEQQQFDGMLSLLLQEHNSILQEVHKLVSEDEQFDLLNSKHKKTKNNYYLEDHIFRFQPVINRYMRVLFQVLKHIENWDIKKQPKYSSCLDPTREAKQYSSLIRSFINSKILSLVALNCLQRDREGRLLYPEYKKLLEKYAFLEHLVFPDDIDELYLQELDMVNDELLTKKMLIITSFQERAFGDNCNKANYLDRLCKYWKVIDTATKMNCKNKTPRTVDSFNQFNKKVEGFLKQFYSDKSSLYDLFMCFYDPVDDDFKDRISLRMLEIDFLKWASSNEDLFQKFVDNSIEILKNKIRKEINDIAHLDLDFSSHSIIRKKLIEQLSNSKDNKLKNLSRKLTDCAEYNYQQYVEDMIENCLKQSSLPSLFISSDFIGLNVAKNEYAATPEGVAWVNEEKERQL